jgi:hypothetical protein
MSEAEKKCYTCAHWQGDKIKVAKQMTEYPTCMNRIHGWPESGPCAISTEWLDVEINGDAWATTEVQANFGCIYWQI